MMSSLWLSGLLNVLFHPPILSNIVESPVWTTATVMAVAFEIIFVVCGCALLGSLGRRGADETRGWPGHGGTPLAPTEIPGPEDWFVWRPAFQG
jgi:hypothetical protein